MYLAPQNIPRAIIVLTLGNSYIVLLYCIVTTNTKHVFCHDKRMLAATKLCLSRQNFSRNKYDKCFVATGILLSRQIRVCRDKSKLVIIGGSCHKYRVRATKRLLSRQKYACHDKTFVVTNIILSRQKLL